MRIVCLAWGSLVWKTGALPVAEAWRADGPRLPIEFARVGDTHELATTLLDGVPTVPVCWAFVDAADLETAREALRERERIPVDRQAAIGSVVVEAPIDPTGPFGAAAIAAWARERPEAIDAVVWTALPPRFADVEGRTPSAEEAIDYLDGLDGPARRHAEHYVRNVPAVIRTPNRSAIEAALGWTPV